MQLMRVALSILAFATSADLGIAQQGGGKKTITMSRATPSGAGAGTIDGGTKQLANDWPATLKFLMDRQLWCTTTIIGPETLITAAHCIDEDANFEVEIREGAKPIGVTCQAHPYFRRADLTFDVALCKSSAVMDSRWYESIDVRLTRIRLDTSLFLLGYGCRDVITQADAGDLYGGWSSVFTLPKSAGDHARTRDGVVICPRDSGGAAYVVGEKTNGPRSIAGVNSGNIAADRVSAIATLAAVGDFIRDWALDNKAQICGVNTNGGNCHTPFMR